MIRLSIVVLIMLLSHAAAYAQEIPGFPTPPAVIDDKSTEAGDGLNNLDDPGAFGGVSLVPSVNAAPLFSFIKWVISPTSTRELLGEELAPFGDSAVTLFLLSMAATMVYLSINAIVLAIKLLVFIWNLFLRIAQFVVALADLIWPG